VHVLVEYGFEYAAQIEGRPQVAVVEQRRARQPRPVGDHAPAAYRAARQKGARARAMIGAARAVHGGGAAEKSERKENIKVNERENKR